jgi:hypothetical protein
MMGYPIARIVTKLTWAREREVSGWLSHFVLLK